MRASHGIIVILIGVCFGAVSRADEDAIQRTWDDTVREMKALGNGDPRAVSPETINEGLRNVRDIWSQLTGGGQQPPGTQPPGTQPGGGHGNAGDPQPQNPPPGVSANPNGGTPPPGSNPPPGNPPATGDNGGPRPPDGANPPPDGQKDAAKPPGQGDQPPTVTGANSPPSAPPQPLVDPMAGKTPEEREAKAENNTKTEVEKNAEWEEKTTGIKPVHGEPKPADEPAGNDAPTVISNSNGGTNAQGVDSRLPSMLSRPPSDGVDARAVTVASPPVLSPNSGAAGSNGEPRAAELNGSRSEAPALAGSRSKPVEAVAAQPQPAALSRLREADSRKSEASLRLLDDMMMTNKPDLKFTSPATASALAMKIDVPPPPARPAGLARRLYEATPALVRRMLTSLSPSHLRRIVAGEGKSRSPASLQAGELERPEARLALPELAGFLPSFGEVDADSGAMIEGALVFSSLILTGLIGAGFTLLLGWRRRRPKEKKA